MVNPVQAPTKNRHYMSTGSGIEVVNATGNEIAFATTDVMNADVVDAMRTLLDSMPLPPPPVMFEGDKMASDAPLRVLLVSSEQYTSFVQSTATSAPCRPTRWRAPRRPATTRSSWARRACGTAS
jgi:hypothetical protein